MPAWNDLLNELESQPNDQEKSSWLKNKQEQALQKVSNYRGNTNVILYASAFLQKPELPASTLQITPEEINGFMSVIYGMDWDTGLTIILHTPGGITNATETIVSYLWEKFKYIEVIVPTFAMSAGTMISLASNKIIYGQTKSTGAN